MNINELIKARRSIYPDSYNDEPIERAFIEQLLENANWAPNHRRTEPWRFKVFHAEGLKRLSDYLANWYEANTPPEKYSTIKLKRTRRKALRSQYVIAICMQRDPKESLPEWEEIAAVSAAVQNMWLTCTAHQIGCYWSSPSSITGADEFLGLANGERCLGLFYLGKYDTNMEFKNQRESISEKVSWIDS